MKITKWIPVLVLVLALVLSAGCVSAGKKLVAGLLSEDKGVPPVIYQDGLNQSQNEGNKTYTTIAIGQIQESADLYLFRTGGRHLGIPFRINRQNVQGLKDLEINVTVYRYRFFNWVEAWSMLWGNYFLVVPSPGKKFLFVFVNVEMVGASQEKDARSWGFEPSHFGIQYRDLVINGSANETWYTPCTRIRQLENDYDYNDVTRTGPYGFYLDNHDGHERCISLDWLRMGRSNSWDGWIAFEIPKDARPDDLKVLGAFDNFGSAYWLLT